MPEESSVKHKDRGKENLSPKQGVGRAGSLWNSIKGFLGYVPLKGLFAIYLLSWGVPML